MAGEKNNTSTTKQNTLLSEVPDYYLQHRPLQPKKDIADYVESMGLLVPPRFSSLSEAVSSGQPFIVRSEHPQDYDGVSGLVKSFKVDDGSKSAGRAVVSRLGKQIDWEKHEATSDYNVLLQIIGLAEILPQADLEYAMTRYSFGSIGRYCQLMRIPVDSFMRDISYSYWEKVGGENRTIAADSAIEGRYHIIRSGFVKVYVLFQDGKVLFNSHAGEYHPREISELVDFYEGIRKLPRFNTSHCPLVEVQSDSGRHHFLQYLRTQDFTPPAFSLERSAEQDEIETQLVRGCTSPEGIVVNTTIYDSDLRVPKVRPEEGHLNEHWDETYDEIMARLRKVQFLTEERFWSHLKQFAGHTLSSKFFRSEISLVLDHAGTYEKVLSKLPKYDEVDLSRSPYQVPLGVISDGKRALVRRV